MQISELQFDPALIQGTAYDGTHGDTLRSSGLHLSQIYRDIENTIVPRDEMDPVVLSTYGAGGFFWERVFEQAFASSIAHGGIIRPGEWEADGITGSPDYINIDKWWVIECKATWRSSRKLDQIEKYFWVWLVQIKGYCRLVGSQDAVLYVFFVNGDYKGSGPVVRVIHFHFSQHELQENWRMVVNWAKKKGWLK